MRPRIGITTSTLNRAPEGPIQLSAAAHLTYARQIQQAGGIPLLLPTLPNFMEYDDLLSSLDGLLFSGGGDIDPAHWNEPPHPALGFVDKLRDEFELSLLQAAIRRDFPVLGICRGIQVMAVAGGGDLWQDIPSQLPDALNHKQDIPRHQPSHEVTVVPESPLSHLLWPQEKTTFLLPVNSFHHQAPRNCGNLLSVAATSSDGVIEALEIPDASFVLGVQWHPEDMADTDPRQARLFSALIDAAS